MNPRIILYIVLFSTITSCKFDDKKTQNKRQNTSYTNVIKSYKLSDDIKKNNKTSVDTILFYSEKKPYKRSNVFSSIKIVPLETSTKSLIGTIEKITYNNGFIFVLSKSQNNDAIIKFDLQGNYISSIRGTGKGPGEYIGITDFDVDNKGNIYIIDHTTDKQIIKYSSNGRYLKTIKLEIPVYAFVIFNNKIYGYNGSTKHFDKPSGDAFFVLDINGKFLKGFLKYEKPLHFTTDLPIFVYKNKVFINPPYSNILYSIDKNDNLNEEYVLIMPEKNKKEEINLFLNDFFEKTYLFKNSIISITSDTNKFGKYFLINFSNLNTKTGKVITPYLFKPDYSNEILFTGFASSYNTVINDSILVTAIEPSLLKEFNLQIKNFHQHASSSTKKLINHIDEMSNPLLILHTLNPDFK